MFIRGSVLMTAEKEKKAGLRVESNFLTVRNASPTNQPSGASFSRALKLHPILHAHKCTPWRCDGPILHGLAWLGWCGLMPLHFPRHTSPVQKSESCPTSSSSGAKVSAGAGAAATATAGGALYESTTVLRLAWAVDRKMPIALSLHTAPPRQPATATRQE